MTTAAETHFICNNFQVQDIVRMTMLLLQELSVKEATKPTSAQIQNNLRNSHAFCSVFSFGGLSRQFLNSAFLFSFLTQPFSSVCRISFHDDVEIGNLLGNSCRCFLLWVTCCGFHSTRTINRWTNTVWRRRYCVTWSQLLVLSFLVFLIFRHHSVFLRSSFGCQDPFKSMEVVQYSSFIPDSLFNAKMLFINIHIYFDLV